MRQVTEDPEGDGKDHRNYQQGVFDFIEFGSSRSDVGDDVSDTEYCTEGQQAKNQLVIPKGGGDVKLRQRHKHSGNAASGTIYA